MLHPNDADIPQDLMWFAGQLKVLIHTRDMKVEIIGEKINITS